MAGKRPRVYRSEIVAGHISSESKLTRTLLDFFEKVAYRVDGDSSSLSGVVYHKRAYIAKGGVSIIEYTSDNIEGEYHDISLNLTSFNPKSLKSLEKKLLKVGDSVQKGILKKA
jgi:hypothetical protein